MKVVIMILLSLTVVSEEQESHIQINKTTKCDSILMNTFKLKGFKHPMIHTKPDICPFVEENCCSLLDQITIMELWKKFSTPKINFHISQMQILFKNLFNLRRMVTFIPLEKYNFEYVKVKDVSFNRKYCFKINGQGKQYKFPEQKFLRKFNSKYYPSKRMLYDSKKIILGDQLQYIDSKQNIAVDNALKIKLLFDNAVKNAKERFVEFVKKRNQSLMKKAAKAIKKRLKNQRKLHKILTTQFFENSQKIDFSKIQEEKLKIVKKPKKSRKLFGFMNLTEHFYSKKTKKLSKEFQDIVEFDQGTYNRKIQKFLDSGDMILRSIMEEIQNQTFFIDDFIDTFKKFVKYSEAQKIQAFVKSQDMKDLDENFMNQVVQKFQAKPFTFFSFPKYKFHYRFFIKFPIFQSDKIRCYQRKKKIKRHILMINQYKYDYCKKVKDNLLVLDDVDMEEYIKKAFKELQYLLNVKKGIYCGICDANQQQYFDYDNQILYFSQNFCKNFLKNSQEYIKFINVFFVQFANDMIQLMNCINSDSKSFQFPQQNAFTPLLARIQNYKECFENIDNDNFLEYCYFICKSFKINGHSEIIEGDIKQIYLFYMKIVEFLQKNKIEMHIKHEMNNEYLMSLDHYFFDTDSPRKLKKVGTHPPNFGKQSIFNSVPKVVNLNEMDLVFLKNEDGFDLLEYSNFSDFYISYDKFISKNFTKEKVSQSITPDVLKHYFKTTEDVIKTFKDDYRITIQDLPTNEEPVIEDQDLNTIEEVAKQDHPQNVQSSDPLVYDKEINNFFN